jgi:inhibitor of cysteine peptidase
MKIKNQGDSIMLKKWVFLSLVFALFISIPSYILVKADNTESNLRLYVDGQLLKGKPSAQFIKGSSYVPLRSVTEIIGAAIKWEADTKTAWITKDQIKIQLIAGNSNAYRNGKAVTLSAAAVLVDDTFMVPARFISEAFGADVHWNTKTKTVSIHTLKDTLPVIGSYAHLKTLLEESQKRNQHEVVFTTMDIAMEEESAAGDFSTTNVQVQGVDEADVVKTDGQYIYQVNQGDIVITKAVPADQMEVISTIDFDEKTFTPAEIYVDDSYLVAIGSMYHPQSYDSTNGMEKKMIMPHHPIQHTTKAFVFNIEDKSNPENIREVELEGHYISSRKVGSSLYFVANQYIDVYSIMNEKTEISPPSFRDSVESDGYQSLSYDSIQYFPDSPEQNYMLVGGIDLENPEQAMDISAYLGSSQNIYASSKHLYVAVTKYEQKMETRSSLRKDIGYNEAKTMIYKFGLNEGIVHYKGEGEVPGSILNQFSMDEHLGNFRIATTKGDMWRSDEHTSKNQLYVLDSALNIIGDIEDIAPGERIYSVRFMGDRAYMVTFRTVDPLFVIDLQNPKQPEILGALKIPGYSDYLHPYDENHIIGFGKEAVEMDRKDHKGNTVDTMAYYLGMKVALFDITDVTNPKEKFNMTIGDRGTESELLHNHKALLFSKEKNIMAFPVTLMEVQSENKLAQNPPEYGQFTFQGAMVYSIDLEKGFELKSKITHMTEEDIKKAGQHWYEPYKSVQRILYIGDNLYTLSPSKIKVNDLNTFKNINELDLPQTHTNR